MKVSKEKLRRSRFLRRSVATCNDRGTWRKAKESVRWTRQQMIDFIVANDIHSFYQLKQLGKHRRDIPTARAFSMKLGKWRDVNEAAYGIKSVPFEKVKDHSREYLIRCAVELGIESGKEWKQKSVLMPHIVPTIYWIQKEWGTWGKFNKEVVNGSFTINTNAYIELAVALNRWPTMTECAEHGIEMKVVLKFFTYKETFDDFLSRRVKFKKPEAETVQDEKPERGPGEASGNASPEAKGTQTEVPPTTA